MILRSPYSSAAQASETTAEFPILPLRNHVLFPGETISIQIDDSRDKELIRVCSDGNRELVVTHSPSPTDVTGDPELHQTGVFAHLVDVKPGPGDTRIVTLEGLRRASLVSIDQVSPYLKGDVARLKQSSSDEDRSIETSRVMATLYEIVQLDPTYSVGLLDGFKITAAEPLRFSDSVASSFRLPLIARQEILDAVDLDLRFERLLFHLDAEAQRLAVMRQLQHPSGDQSPDGIVAPRLGGAAALNATSQSRWASRKRKQINSSPNLPPEVAARALIEVDRLEQLSTASAEYGVTKNYLNQLLSLPWGKCTPETYEISAVERVLSSEYYGPQNIKNQILQRISVRKLLGGTNEGPTLCLIGAPGTGKASLAKAIAHALGKELIRISVGGISDVAEIKGTTRTFLGAMPGKFIRTLQGAKSCDPVILIEDVDYFNMENDSSVNMALLDVIDTRRNAQFLDHYIGVPFDLSNILFICSVRSFEEIPEPFIPRFEILEIPGYIEREKIAISKRYIIPSLLKRHGLTKAEFKLSDKVMSKIISTYTQEAGLLQFSQQLEKIMRKVAFEKAVNKKKSWLISEKNLETYLGSSLFIPEKAESEPEIGTATGLAWTGAGGDLMFIEGLKMRGDGGIITTGSLGEVMRESIQAAHSYVRSKADVLGIDFSDFNEFDVHIHFPSGAIPKDGPSAGVTVCLVIASVMSERPIRNDIAMTGEVTLRGKVLPVGGIKEKVSAAYRAGIYHVAIPKENKKDIKELPKEIARKTKFTYLERVDELFELCLMDFTPSAYTLEKIFAEEIEKAKKSKPKPKTRRKTSRAARSPKKS